MSRERAQALLCENFGPFGKLNFPYIKMGNIDSLHLFGDTELMILAMYWHNRGRWKRCLDIGANLGLHSICMAKMGMQLHAYEPDEEHFQKLCANLVANKCTAEVAVFQLAVHTSNGTANFIRVLNNLTGNHLEGYKQSYGPRETVQVRTIDCRKLWSDADFAKIDSEGNEAELLLTLTKADMQHLSLVAEVRNAVNAGRIFNHFIQVLNVPIWSQKTDWAKVSSFDDMPKQNRDGSIFIGHRGPWE